MFAGMSMCYESALYELTLNGYIGFYITFALPPVSGSESSRLSHTRNMSWCLIISIIFPLISAFFPQLNSARRVQEWGQGHG